MLWQLPYRSNELYYQLFTSMCHWWSWYRSDILNGVGENTSYPEVAPVTARYEVFQAQLEIIGHEIVHMASDLTWSARFVPLEWNCKLQIAQNVSGKPPRFVVFSKFTNIAHKSCHLTSLLLTLSPPEYFLFHKEALFFNCAISVLDLPLLALCLHCRLQNLPSPWASSAVGRPWVQVKDRLPILLEKNSCSPLTALFAVQQPLSSLHF